MKVINIYSIKKNIDKLLRGESTNFIDSKDLKEITSKLKKNDYKIYKPYPDASKVILYKDKIKDILLYEIKSDDKLRHQDILGTMFSLDITNEMFGDIIVDNNRYYIFIVKDIENYIKSNLLQIKNSKVELLSRNIDYLKDYIQKYEEYEVIVSSLRIDNVISKITNLNRKDIITKIKDKEIIVNYEIIKKPFYLLKENDIFSIRKYGKYKFIGIIKNTKKDNYVIKYLKYV